MIISNKVAETLVAKTDKIPHQTTLCQTIRVHDQTLFQNKVKTFTAKVYLLPPESTFCKGLCQ